MSDDKRVMSVKARALRCTTFILILVGSIFVIQYTLFSSSRIENVYNPPHHHHSLGANAESANFSISSEESMNCSSPKLQNFFTHLDYSFVDIIPHMEKNRIDTELLLQCATSFSNILDALGSTALYPVKLDFTGNIGRIETRWQINKEKYSNLFAIIEEERQAGKHTQSDSITTSILWLNRGLLFLSNVFDFMEQDGDFSQTIDRAYATVLKPHHSFLVKQTVKWAMLAIPSKETAQISLSDRDGDYSKPEYVACLYAEMEKYNDALVKVTNTLREYYMNKLHIRIS